MNKTNSSNLGIEPISKLLFKQALPASIGILVMSLNILIDTIFVGQWIGSIAIAAINVVLPVSFFIAALGMAIGIGGSSIISRSLGSENIQKAKYTFANQITLTILITVSFVFIGLYFIEGDGWKSAWSNLLYINNYVYESYMGWTWSLAIEEQFYIVIPFLIAFVIPKFKNKVPIFLFLGLLCVAMTYYYSIEIFDFKVPFESEFLDERWKDWFWGYYMLTHLRYGGLLSGVIGAYLNVYHQDRVKNFFSKKRTLSNILFIISILLFILISSVSLGQWTDLNKSIFDGYHNNIPRFYEIVHRELFSYSVVFIIFSCLYSSTKLVKPINSFLSAKFFYPIAQISYSAYLFHEMFMFWFFPKFNIYAEGVLTDLEIVWANSLISIIVIIFSATLMYLFIEQPFQDLKSRIKTK